MKSLILFIAFGFSVYKLYTIYRTPPARPAPRGYTVYYPNKHHSRITRTVAPNFKCDGRKYCSQMRSCAEARYFISHCPNTKMDGDHDGIPCEKQWCY